jgi:hypothetical protein
MKHRWRWLPISQAEHLMNGAANKKANPFLMGLPLCELDWPERNNYPACG